MRLALRTWIAVLAALTMTAACVSYPAPPAPSKYERAWNAALGGVQDAGVTIMHAEPNSGLIRGTKNGIDVTVTVTRLPDGAVKVQFDSKGETKNDPQLPERFSQAYDRRMGR
ncbi:hypothetical protein [Niveibacterium sp.]|uniref:hypothetical protein n=1 Tax=Niveibacterium sp. TaxID=2017444 RepID=UPI0035B0F34F